MNITHIGIWVGFSFFVIIALSIDTFLLDKKYARPHGPMRVALYWSLLWITLALVFNGLFWLYLYYTAGAAIAHTKSMAFLAGYLIEKSLSIDNLFAFYMVFHQLQIPLLYQQRVFSYGIWSAIILRLMLILLGSWLITRFHWMLFIMGAFLLLTGLKMLFTSTERTEEQNRFLLWLQRHLRVTPLLHENRFLVKQNGLLYATPLLLALIFIEISDIIFALDSIPAIFGITQDPFIVWTSNIFAILGLRALYFLLAGAIQRFYLLKYGIAFILAFIGSKMLLEPWLSLSVLLSLGVIVTILLGCTLASLLFRK